MESDDESVSDEGGYYDDDEESYESDSDDSDQGMQNIYRVLQETDVREVQNEQIERLSSTLSLSKCEATKLLYHYRWNDLLLVDEWFADEEKVRTKAGLLHSTTNFFGRDILGTCGICFESFPLDHHNFYPTVCGHSYCATCWKDYLNISINDGPGCLSLRCPEPKCHAAVVDRGMINKLCLCSHAFCWNCTEEPHRPIDCDMMAKWSLRIKLKRKPCSSTCRVRRRLVLRSCINVEFYRRLMSKSSKTTELRMFPLFYLYPKTTQSISFTTIGGTTRCSSMIGLQMKKGLEPLLGW